MSAVEQIIGRLVESGMSPIEAAGLVARAGAEMSAPQRSKGAIRTERWRQNKASQNVTKRHAEDHDGEQIEASLNVTDRHKTSQGDGPHISKKKDSSPKVKASRLPDDWRPTVADVDYATSKGMARDRIPIVAEKFRNHWLSKSGKGATSPNWSLRWHTWVLNELEWNRGVNGARPVQPGLDGII